MLTQLAIEGSDADTERKICLPAACATYAEVTKRGKEFWNEFEYYLSDLTVGLVLDVLLVGLMATPAVIGKHHVAHNATGINPIGVQQRTLRISLCPSIKSI